MNLLLIPLISFIFVFLSAGGVVLLRLTPQRRIERRERAQCLEIKRQKQAQADALLSYAWSKAEREMQRERAENQIAINPIINAAPDSYPNS